MNKPPNIRKVTYILMYIEYTQIKAAAVKLTYYFDFDFQPGPITAYKLNFSEL